VNYWYISADSRVGLTEMGGAKARHSALFGLKKLARSSGEGDFSSEKTGSFASRGFRPGIELLPATETGINMTSDEFHELGEDMASMDRKNLRRIDPRPLHRSSLAPEFFDS
jgi:hypothetical protein